MQVSGSDRFRIACRSPCGASSITIASAGICLQPSSKRTWVKRLLVKYSAEQYFASCVFHSDSGIEVLIHFEERFLGFCIT